MSFYKNYTYRDNYCQQSMFHNPCFSGRVTFMPGPIPACYHMPFGYYSNPFMSLRSMDSYKTHGNIIGLCPVGPATSGAFRERR